MNEIMGVYTGRSLSVRVPHLLLLLRPYTCFVFKYVFIGFEKEVERERETWI